MKPIANLLLSSLFVLAILSSCKEKRAEQPHISKEILPQVETALQNLVQVWYPRTIDSANGGFWSDFNHRWEKQGEQNKFLVSQARHVWTASTLAEFYKDDEYQKIAEHGYQFLRDHMWDTINGGFHSLLRTDGELLSTNKSTYGNSFAIYGLSAYYKVSNDAAALNLAKKTFYWLEKHAHDSVHKGYFDVLQQDGSWMLNITENDNDYANFIRKDWKDQNSSIHLLECFTALYEVWPDALVKERLEEMLLLIRDTITTEKGHLTLHLQRDWKPVSLKDSSETYRKEHFALDHVSFGHDIETAFLLLEASHALGGKHDSITLIKGKKMVDHALEWGWDTEKGGFFEGGYYWEKTGDRTVEDNRKVWWTQAEGLNSLLLMSKLHPEETHYYDLFKKQWHYINTYLIDHDRGGWYNAGFDTSPDATQSAKAQIWKVNYHDGRTLINVIRMLKDEFPLTKKAH